MVHACDNDDIFRAMNKRSNTIARAVNIDQKAICCDGIGTHEVIIADCNFGIDSIFFLPGSWRLYGQERCSQLSLAVLKPISARVIEPPQDTVFPFGQIRCDSP